MLDKMSEPQRMILQAAVARKDRILQPPANARGAAAKAFISKLIEAGWVKRSRLRRAHQFGERRGEQRRICAEADPEGPEGGRYGERRGRRRRQGVGSTSRGDGDDESVYATGEAASR